MNFVIIAIIKEITSLYIVSNYIYKLVKKPKFTQRPFLHIGTALPPIGTSTPANVFGIFG